MVVSKADTVSGFRKDDTVKGVDEDLELDRDWLERFRTGDPDALGRVYRRYGPDLARFLRKGFRFTSGGRPCQYYGAQSTFELEDYLQEIFARAFTERARWGYDGLTPFTGYILGIAKNLVIDDFRRKERAMVSFGWVPPERPDEGARERPSEPLGGVYARSGDPREDAERMQLAETVRVTIESLAERERVVYQLRFVEELEHKEISSQTGYSVSQVKTSEERIRRLFFQNLRQRGLLEGYEERKRGWLRFTRTPSDSKA